MIKDQPLVSIILSVYNDEKYIDKCLESIINQSFKSFELIVINDGSTDGSLNKIQSFEDERIRLFSQKNSGLPKSLNKAINLSRGKYIARIDADDICFKNRIESQFYYMERNPNVDILGSNAMIIDEAGKILHQKKVLSHSEDIHLSAHLFCPLIHPTYFVKKSTYKELNGYDENFQYAQDYDFILRAILQKKHIENLSSNTIFYRISSNNLNSKKAVTQMKYACIAQENYLLSKKNQSGNKKLKTNLIKPKNIKALKIEILAYDFFQFLQKKKHQKIFPIFKVMIQIIQFKTLIFNKSLRRSVINERNYFKKFQSKLV